MDKTSTPLNWALIGCGGIGRAQVRWAAETPDIKAHAFCDINEDAARSLSEMHVASYHTTSPDKIFADPQIDIVSIATTHDTHKDLALAAFAAGKHVFLEKPMAMSTDDCLAIIRAHKEAGTQLMLDLQRRNFIRFAISAGPSSRHINEIHEIIIIIIIIIISIVIFGTLAIV